jgi:hypothetical protein
MDLTWPKIVLICLYAFSLLATIATIGRKREPITPGSAAFSTITIGLMVWLVVIA